MNISDLRQQPHLSVSSINTYIDCGLLYRFSRIDNIKPDFIPDNLVFGSCIHRVLAEFNQEKMMGNILSSSDVGNLFRKDWEETAKDNEEIRYFKGSSYQYLLYQGIGLIDEFMKQASESPSTVIAIEEPFVFHIDGLDIPLIGVMDLVEEDEDGVTITDYKTSGKAMAVSDVDASFQLTVYYTAAKANGYGNRDVNLKFDCLIKTRKPRFERIFTSRTREDSIKAIKKIQKVWEGIQKEVFIPNDASWRCWGCAYKAACDAWFLE